MPAGDIEPLMTLLRRYATEAAREEARMFCDELVDWHWRWRTTTAAWRGVTDPRMPGKRLQAFAELGSALRTPRIAVRRERRRQDRLEIVRPVAVLVQREIRRSPGAASRPARRRFARLSPRVFACMMARIASTCWSISAQRQPRDVRRVLDQPAQAVGDRRDQRIAEGRGLALDVVRGAEQRVARCLVDAARP